MANYVLKRSLNQDPKYTGQKVRESKVYAQRKFHCGELAKKILQATEMKGKSVKCFFSSFVAKKINVRVASVKFDDFSRVNFHL